jgi:hypothetical protein
MVQTNSRPNPSSSFANASSEITPGVRGVKMFEQNPSKSINCFAFDIAPQSSSPYESSGDELFHAFVLQCEPDLASFTLNGAKLQLRTGDHLIIKAGSTFNFSNSSLTISLRLRIVHKKRCAHI